MKNLLILFFLFYSLTTQSQSLQLAEEPHQLNPNIDRRFITRLGLDNSPNNWKEKIINLLIIGQDGKSDFPFPYIKNELGQNTLRLSSRADASLLLSFNKETRQISIFSFERTWRPFGNEILTHEYIIKGRRHYINLIRNKVEGLVKELRQEDKYLINGSLHIHGIVEADFDSFKKIVSVFSEQFFSSVKLAFAFKDHAIELTKALTNKPSLLDILRNRKQYRSAGYQRSFNHAVFVSAVLGLLAYTINEAGELKLLEEKVFENSFNQISRTMDYKTLLNSLILENGQSVISYAGYVGQNSPVNIFLLGHNQGSFLYFNKGVRKVFLNEHSAQSSDGLLNHVVVNPISFLRIKDLKSKL